MQEYSKRMLSAGWVLHSLGQERWKCISPENRSFYYEEGKWTPEEPDLSGELEKNETSIEEGIYSPFSGTSRLTVNPESTQAGLLTQWLIRQDHIKGKSILRARVAPDPVGDENLYEAGARRVTTLLQPWFSAPDNQRHLTSHLLICEHVADVLPKSHRSPTLKRLISHLSPDADAYFSFYQMEALPLDRPHETLMDGYVFPHGPHHVFLKPSLPGQCATSLQKSLGGFAEEVDLLYNEIFCRWFPNE